MSIAGQDRQLLVTAAALLGVALLVSFASDAESRSLYKDKPSRDEQAETSHIPPPLKPRKSTLLHSAWVIIAIILFIVLGAIGIYYWVLFYPILCKKERKYDVMQMSAKP